MFVKTIRGEKLEISDSDMHQLKMRFNMDNAVEDQVGTVMIPTGCLLCNKYLNKGCTECYFRQYEVKGGVFYTKQLGCLWIIENEIGIDLEAFEPSRYSINIYDEKDEQAVGKIKAWLDSFEKVKEKVEV
ncbi:MAG: hypothetical protein ACTSRU_20625, partial [Candidatus Hodarchaeales archaeon]